MLTKTKIALVLCGCLISGVAAAQNTNAPMKPGKQKMLERFDTNKDGKLDTAERAIRFDVKATELFKKLDTDGNGQLSLTEFKTAKLHKGKKHRHARRMFRRGLGRQ